MGYKYKVAETPENDPRDMEFPPEQYKQVLINGETYYIPRHLSHGQEEKVIRNIERATRSYNSVHPKTVQKEVEEDMTNQSKAFEELFEGIGAIGAIAFIVGLVTGTIYGLVTVYHMYGVLGVIVTLIVGGLAVALTGFMGASLSERLEA